LISNLSVYCPTAIHSEFLYNCSWTGPLSQSESHLQSCVYAKSICPNDGCEFNGRKLDMNDHFQSCDFQLVNCTNSGCPEQIQRRNTPEHSLNCDYRSIECPNLGCGQHFAFKDMIDHLQCHCPMQVVACPLIGIGCTSECSGYVRRVDLEGHIAQPSNMMVFIQQVVTKIQQQEREIDDLKSSLRDLTLTQQDRSIREEARMAQLEEMVAELQLQQSNSSGSSTPSSF